MTKLDFLYSPEKISHLFRIFSDDEAHKKEAQILGKMERKSQIMGNSLRNIQTGIKTENIIRWTGVFENHSTKTVKEDYNGKCY